MNTLMYGGGPYKDIMPWGKELFLKRGLLKSVAITDKIDTIEWSTYGERTNLPSALVWGTAGAAVGGLIGSVIGVSLSKSDEVMYYHIYFKKGFDIEDLQLVTADKGLIHWIDEWIKKDNGFGRIRKL